MLALVPPGLPSFVANTDASRRVRQAYVQHVVSSVLTYRIFHPFLFTLGRRYDGADLLFQDMSRKLRHKSIRRECVWRQHTLHAAYSVSSAKQSINKVATVIIDEIVNQIKHFADPTHIERITTAVRRIVKIAAETWRYARLERELITARLPTAEDSKEPINEWFESDDHGEPKRNDLPSKGGLPRRVLLRLLPIICREPTHEELRDDTTIDDQGCMYSNGIALFSDSPAVIARTEELQQRGLEQPLSPTKKTAEKVEQQHSTARSSSNSPPSQSTHAASSTPLKPISPTSKVAGKAEPQHSKAQSSSTSPPTQSTQAAASSTPLKPTSPTSKAAEKVKPQHSKAQSSSTSPPTQSAHASSSTPSKPISPPQPGQSNDREKKGAYRPDHSALLTQTKEGPRTVKDTKESPERKSSENSIPPRRQQSETPLSERSNSRSSRDTDTGTLSDRPSLNPKTGREDRIPNWGSAGGRVPGAYGEGW